MVEKELVSPYMNWQELAKILKKGDLIEFSRYNQLGSGRGVYQHWAVYVGILKGVPHVVHYSNEDLSGAAKSWAFIEISGNVEVQFETLEIAANQCQVRKNNGWDEMYAPLSADEIAKTAKTMIGEQGYSLPSNNCEHLAHFCRYGKKRSGQVSRMKAVGLGGIIVGIAGSLAAYGLSKL